jgi:hypothetical protein
MKKLLVAACAANMLGSVCVASAGQLETVAQILQDRSPWCRKAECVTFGPKELVWLSVDPAIAKYPPPLCSIFRIDDELLWRNVKSLSRIISGGIFPAHSIPIGFTTNAMMVESSMKYFCCCHQTGYSWVEREQNIVATCPHGDES